MVMKKTLRKTPPGPRQPGQLDPTVSHQSTVSTSRSPVAAPAPSAAGATGPVTSNLSSRSSVTAASESPATGAWDPEKSGLSNEKMPFLTFRTLSMTILVSFGGILFGYDTGQISGFLEMQNFKDRFGNTNPPGFTDVRSGLIVAMLSIGTLFGALIAGRVADINHIGRKYSITGWVVIFCVGVVVQMTSGYGKWYQVMIGRIIAGFGIGALSTLVPTYQGESAPRHIRGAIVCCYQLFITCGILIADAINAGTEHIQSAASWQITMGIGYVFAVALGAGILLFPETPRHDFRYGRIEKAATSIARFHGVPENHVIIKDQLEDMQEKLVIEQEAGQMPWYKVFTQPTMPYRIFLGVVIQAFQQLTGANYFFYYGTTIFVSVGISNSYITAIILGAVNVVCTFPGLWFVERFGRRICLMIGASWMFMCFIVFASCGAYGLVQPDGSYSSKYGNIMIVFACLFIAAFASTWGPMAWCVTSEIFPGKYRSRCIGICAASNWIWNFLLAFFTPFITSAIGFKFGYVFAGCNGAAAIFVFFFLPETKGRSLEEIDTMFHNNVKPWQSVNWQPPRTRSVGAEKMRLNSGGEAILRAQRDSEAHVRRQSQAMMGGHSALGSDAAGARIAAAGN